MREREKLPGGKVQVGVAMPPQDEGQPPMTVEIDLDALRETVAKGGCCDPDAAVAEARRKIESGEVAALASKVMDEYVRIAPPEANGDMFGYLEMEYIAFRQLMDDAEPDFLPDLHEDMLAAALTFGVRVKVPMKGLGKDGGDGEAWLPTPLLKRSEDMLNAVQYAILAAASRAKRIGSESYRLWRDALEVLMRRDFGHGGEMKGDDVKRLIDCLKAANMMLFLDAAVADYVPLQQAGGEDEGEADDGI